MTSASLLVFDRDPVRCALHVAALSRASISVLAFDKLTSVLGALDHAHGSAVFLFDHPDTDVLQHVSALCALDTPPAVVVFGPEIAVPTAVACLKAGALDVIATPDLPTEELVAIAERALAVPAPRAVSDVDEAFRRAVRARERDTEAFAQRLVATAQGTRHFANCATFPELATQALIVLRENLNASGGALFLLEGSEWRMMHAANLAHDFVLQAPHDHAVEQTFAGRHVASEPAGTAALSRFLRKSRGAIAAFALRSAEGALLGLLLLHRPNAVEFGERDLELGRLILAHVAEALKSIRLTDSLRKSEARFHSIASNVPGVVFQAQCGPGEINKFTYMSDSSTEIFGIRPERFLFAPVVFLERVIVDDLPALLRSLRDSVTSIGPWQWEGRILGEGGRTRWIQISARPTIGDEDTTQISYDGLMLDITESKELEFQLQLADRMVSVGTLAAGVAHEINNPLTYVMANLGLIREEIDELVPLRSRVELHTLLDEASEGAERVTQIVRDLKVFSRGDERRAEDPISVQEVLETSLNMAGNELRHRAHVVKEISPTPMVFANHARLGQVFINLLINAAQAIPEGHVDENTVRISTSTDATGRAVIAFSDTGTGIPEEARKRIFDPFFTTKPVGVGTGLGLPICHRIVEEMGGEITVDSAPGRGSTFTVAIPAAEAAPSKVPSLDRTAVVTRRRAKVLIVDDEAGVVSALKRGLRGHEVVAALGGRAALEELRRHNFFDVILCDLMMPEFSGIDLFRAVEEEFPHLVDNVVFMTGGAFTARAREFLRDTASTHVSKPFQLREIELLIKAKLGDDSTSGRVARPGASHPGN